MDQNGQHSVLITRTPGQRRINTFKLFCINFAGLQASVDNIFLWIGLNDLANEGTFVFDDGSTVSVYISFLSVVYFFN